MVDVAYLAAAWAPTADEGGLILLADWGNWVCPPHMLLLFVADPSPSTRSSSLMTVRLLCFEFLPAHQNNAKKYGSQSLTRASSRMTSPPRKRSSTR